MMQWPAGAVTRPEKDTDVTLTATITWKGLSTTKDFTFTVKAAPKQIEDAEYTDYFFAYFAGEGYSDGEQIYFASSQDGMNWDDLITTIRFITSTLGEKGVRESVYLVLGRRQILSDRDRPEDQRWKRMGCSAEQRKSEPDDLGIYRSCKLVR